MQTTNSGPVVLVLVLVALTGHGSGRELSGQSTTKHGPSNDTDLLPSSPLETQADRLYPDIVVPPDDARFQLVTKLIDFQQFKQTFKRNYATIMEEMSRKRLFLARAMRVVISAFKYLRGLVTSCFSINHFSDWTTEELKQMWNKMLDLDRYIGADIIDDNKLDLLLRNSIEQQKQLQDALISSQTSGPDASKANPTNWSGSNFTRIKLAHLGLLLGPETNPLDAPVGEPSSGHNPGLIGRVLNYFYQSVQPDDELATETVEEHQGGPADEIFLDHRDSGCISAIRDQKRCGSCYAFAMIALAEWLYCKQTGRLISLSEQYIVDCGGRTGCSGCWGGSIIQASEFVINFGLELSHTYGYLGKESTCPYEAHLDSDQMGLIRMHLERLIFVPISRFADILEVSPILISINTELQFYEYGKGIYVANGAICNENPNEGHAVVLIGHGRQDGHEYWLIRNSFGTDWGEQGYFRLSKASSCLIRGPVGFIFGTLSPDGKRLRVQTGQNRNYDPKIVINHLRDRDPLSGRLDADNITRSKLDD